MQRGRDHGLPLYGDWKTRCEGLKRSVSIEIIAREQSYDLPYSLKNYVSRNLTELLFDFKFCMIIYIRSDTILVA